MRKKGFACKVHGLTEAYVNARGSNRRCRLCTLDKNAVYQKTHTEVRDRIVKDWYWRNVEAQRARLRARSAEAKRLVFNEYGRACVCCGEDGESFLTIDHINNDGAEHRRRIGNGGLYRWLIKNEFPKDNFQTLCYNCNNSKRVNKGICAHKTGLRLVTSGG